MPKKVKQQEEPKVEISEVVLIPPEVDGAPVVEPIPEPVVAVKAEAPVVEQLPEVVPEPVPVVPEPEPEPPTPRASKKSKRVSVEPPVELPVNGNGEFYPHDSIAFQKLEEKATKAQEAFEREEKARKELESLNSKLLAEKTALLESLSGEKGAISDYQEKVAKITAQKNDLDNQLRVSFVEFCDERRLKINKQQHDELLMDQLDEKCR